MCRIQNCPFIYCWLATFHFLVPLSFLAFCLFLLSLLCIYFFVRLFVLFCFVFFASFSGKRPSTINIRAYCESY